MPTGWLLDRWEALHAWGTRQPVFRRFTECLRVLLSAGFFGPGLVKLTGHHFAPVGMPGPAGAMFDALFAIGPYWRFIGGAQVAAALMLMVPGLASIGNLFFFVVILNIFMITASLDFAGTVYVTGLMLLGSLYLLLWDYPRWKLLLPGATTAARPQAPRVPALERAGYLACAVSGWMFFSVMRGFIPSPFAGWLVYAALGLAPIGMALVGQSWLRSAWRHLAARRARSGAAAPEAA
jgi:hypothetical protein